MPRRDHPHQDAIHVAGWVSLFTLHAIWPPALMTLSDFRIEQRFLSTAMVAFFLAAAAGWTLLLAERRSLLRYTAGAILLGILIALYPSTRAWWILR